MRCRARCAPDRDWYFAFSVCSASRSLRSHLASGITHNAMAINQANQKNENVHIRSGCGGTGGPLPRIPRRDTRVPHRSSPGPCVRRHVCWCDGTCVRVSVCVLVMCVRARACVRTHCLQYTGTRADLLPKTAAPVPRAAVVRRGDDEEPCFVDIFANEL